MKGNNNKNNNKNYNRNNNNKFNIREPSSNNNINLNAKTSFYSHSKNSSALNQNSSMNKNMISNANFKKRQKELEMAKKKELEIQKMKKENELEEQIRDHLKCYICLSKVTKPKMCKYCKRISCEKCINQWLENHNVCGICKRQVSSSDMISIPFLDDMSAFFINNIDNRSKKEKIFNQKEEDEKFNLNMKNIDIKNKSFNNLINNDNNVAFNNNNLPTIVSESNENSELFEKEENELCPEHGDKINYYCLQCDKYFCGQCLIYFGKEAHKHDNHFIVNVDKINDLGVNEAINEYKKLPQTKSKLEDLIGQCNLKLRENEIKKKSFIKYCDLIKDSIINKIVSDSNDYKKALNIVKDSKNNFRNNSMMIQQELSFLLNQDNFNQNQGQQILQKIQNINFIEPSLIGKIKTNVANSSKLSMENYQTNFIEKEINHPQGGQYNNNEELMKLNLNIIPDYPCDLFIKFIQNKISISIMTISKKYEEIYSYIIFKNKQYGLEFMHLSERKIDDRTLANEEKVIQTNTIELPYEKFLYLFNEENKLNLKLYITKIFFK